MEPCSRGSLAAPFHGRSPDALKGWISHQGWLSRRQHRWDPYQRLVDFGRLTSLLTNASDVEYVPTDWGKEAGSNGGIDALFSAIQIPHWLMTAGAILVTGVWRWPARAVCLLIAYSTPCPSQGFCAIFNAGGNRQPCGIASECENEFIQQTERRIAPLSA
jgi:hypothetical protein